MKARIAPVLASLLVLGGCLARPADGALEEACKARLGARLAEWTMASVATDVAAWAHTQGFDPRVARGDFDGDGRVDVALLVQARATPVLEYPERISASRVAVCFDRSSGLSVLSSPPWNLTSCHAVPPSAAGVGPSRASTANANSSARIISRILRVIFAHWKVYIRLCATSSPSAIGRPCPSIRNPLGRRR